MASTRLAYFPPKCSVLSQTFVNSHAIYSEIILAPIHKTFALLWAFVISAENKSLTKDALIPFTLFATIDTPMPVPQIIMPFSYSPLATALATALAYTG